METSAMINVQTFLSLKVTIFDFASVVGSGETARFTAIKLKTAII
jgi:hypothetical protein